MVRKDDLLNGKVDLKELQHPYFTSERFFKTKTEQTTKTKLDLNKNDKILLFSPHPDDEVLGACGLLQKCYSEQIDVKVAYMTSGKTAGDPFLRQKEAINGISKIGGKEESLLFLNMPFYDRSDRVVTEEDYEYVRNVLRKYTPTAVYVCADLFDPNRTHKKCYEILLKILDEEKSKEFEMISVFFYFSVWYWPEECEYTHILPYDFENL